MGRFDGRGESREKGERKRLRLFCGVVAVPLAFLGLGVYRAWIEIVFVGSFVEFPAMAFSGRDVFDLTMVVTAVACTLLARRIGPFFNKPLVFAVCGVALTASTALMFASCWLPGIAPAAGLPAGVLGGFGIALLILFWSELYGCLNPLRVALYYSASIVAGALLLYVYRGFMLPWLFVMTALLPALSLVGLRRGFAGLPAAELPSTSWTRFSVPWKAVLFMAAYAFAYGLMEGDLYAGAFGPHSAPGALAVGLLVFLGVAVRGGRFDFGIIYRVALPLMVVALFLVPALGHIQGTAASFCVSAGYTAQSILIMLIMANICYRYGVSAIWLFGIERSVRQVSMWLGRVVTDGAQRADVLGGALGGNGEMLVSLLTVVAIVVATTILFSERELSSRWGANFLAGGVDSAAMIRKQELADRCAEVARVYKLSTREEEVLLLLAQRKTVGIIERELFIANGTAKAHVRHIYQKLDIHTRQELFDLLGVEARDGVKAGAAPLDDAL
ncbi:LuxR C-terminal-related transcriptional regulator [Eggerthella sinensis]|uniref:helix-turn-helix transcriptional regulator n=1 Tax=Eggerthella sinensis TaxID=242230 RepID=UPI00248E5C30|nr:LuxR C-terminal-related transcriptional regulator [Eggerthella sinensis]